MAKFIVPTDASIHTSRSFLMKNNFFELSPEDLAILEFNPHYMHLEPLGLAMIASWGAWCKRQGMSVCRLKCTSRLHQECTG